MRENREWIGFYGGEKGELENLLSRFKIVIGNLGDIMSGEKMLKGFRGGYGELGIMIGLLLGGGGWFGKEVEVGWIMEV